MNPIARALASEPPDSPRKAALFELLPLGAFVALASLAASAWLVFDQTDLPAGVAFVLGLAGVAFALMSLLFSVLSGLGWMGRGHHWVGGAMLLLRVALSFTVFVEVVRADPRSGAGVAIDALLLAAWIGMPIVSAWLAATVPAHKSGAAQAAIPNQS